MRRRKEQKSTRYLFNLQETADERRQRHELEEALDMSGAEVVRRGLALLAQAHGLRFVARVRER